MSNWHKYDCLGEQEHNMSPQFFEQYKEKLMALFDGMTEKLQKYPHFKGISFYKSTISEQFGIDLLHNTAYISDGYAVRYLFTSFDNADADEIISKCEADWQAKDNPEAIEKYYANSVAKLIASCEKYGYD